MMLFGLASGLLAGWSLGANDAANVFGTAVASRMLRYATAVSLAAVFVILGGVVNGPAAMGTVSELGNIDTLPAAFVSLAAAGLIVTLMTRAGMPVSVSQALVGALIGYRLSCESGIDEPTRILLRKILLTWIASPILAASLAVLIYVLLARLFRRLPMPLFALDRWLRIGLVAAGCYGAWALGGNNMANVVGVYLGLDMLPAVSIGPIELSEARMLALFGGAAISLGIVTYSRRVILTVGRDLVKLDATTALIAVTAQAIVVDLFAHTWHFGSFVFPAIPVSTSQAIVGAVLGIGVVRGLQSVNKRLLIRIALSAIATPLFAAGFSYLVLR
ncbi:MAG: inorganic phosphate transporter [Gammaproteobacteria bacterium]